MQARATSQTAMLGHIAGAWVSQAIYVAAKLGIADLLHAGPRPVSALAAATETHERSLYRVLRALASLGIFAEHPDGSFALTDAAECLRRDAPGSLRPYAIMMGESWTWRSCGEMLHSVRTGEAAFQHIFGMPTFDYHACNPESARISAEGLTSRSAVENAAVITAYDFSRSKLIVDVGGGQGTLLASVLDASPTSAGILFDMPHVADMAARLLQRADGDHRGRVQGGDFFQSVPAGGDLYLLKKVIHDWEDPEARTILQNCRTAMPPHGKLLLIELVVPSGNEPSFAKMLDLVMLFLAGGRERTADEHRELLASAGFRLERIIPTGSTVSIIEAVSV
jgi:hypothetical protein